MQKVTSGEFDRQIQEKQFAAIEGAERRAETVRERTAPGAYSRGVAYSMCAVPRDSTAPE